jgi:hypothetical protein
MEVGGLRDPLHSENRMSRTSPGLQAVIHDVVGVIPNADAEVASGVLG